ncbi:MAG: DUF3078 domain-containing protein [Chitinophagales bacterium]|nr:DUF3078 domain-containing protein [Chitinophagales bacterium]
MNNFYKVFLMLILAFGLSNVNAQKEETLEAATDREKISGKLGEISDTAKWDWGGTGAIQFGQTALVNWAAGGNSQIAVNFHVFAFANLVKKRHIWENTFDANWGIVKFKGEGAQINQNLMVLNSQYGYKLTKTLFLSGLVNVQSAVTKGYDYAEAPKKLITQFASPMYIKTAIGIDYKPKPYFSIFLSPVAGKFTIVANDNIANLDRYIPATTDANGNRYYNKNFRAEFGALARFSFQKEVFKNVNVRSVLELFMSYTDPNKTNRKNIDVDWQTGIDLKVNDWLAVNLFTHLLYDDNTSWAKVDKNGDAVYLKNPDTGDLYKDADGNFIQQNTTGVQFREVLTVGLTYNFGKDKPKKKGKE